MEDFSNPFTHLFQQWSNGWANLNPVNRDVNTNNGASYVPATAQQLVSASIDVPANFSDAAAQIPSTVADAASSFFPSGTTIAEYAIGAAVLLLLILLVLGKLEAL